MDSDGSMPSSSLSSHRHQLELAAGLRPIALGQVDLDKSVMGGFAQWFQADRGECGLGGVGVTAGCAQSSGKALQCMQPCLAQPFSLVLHPVVIPVRQQIAD